MRVRRHGDLKRDLRDRIPMDATQPARGGRQFDYENFIVGETVLFGRVKVTTEDIICYARAFDPQPFHLSEAARAATSHARATADTNAFPDRSSQSTVLALGSTDPITGMIADWTGMIITAYVGGRSIEKVARIFARRS